MLLGIYFLFFSMPFLKLSLAVFGAFSTASLILICCDYLNLTDTLNPGFGALHVESGANLIIAVVLTTIGGILGGYLGWEDEFSMIVWIGMCDGAYLGVFLYAIVLFWTNNVIIFIACVFLSMCFLGFYANDKYESPSSPEDLKQMFTLLTTLNGSYIATLAIGLAVGGFPLPFTTF